MTAEDAPDKRVSTTSSTLDWMRRKILALAKDPSIDQESMALLRTQVEQAENAGAKVGPESAASAASPAFTVVRSTRDLKESVDRLTTVESVAVELVTDGRDSRKHEVVGVALATASSSIYIPVGHRDRSTGSLLMDQIPLVTVVSDLNMATLPLVAHDAKRVLHCLGTITGGSLTIVWDTQIAALLDEAGEAAKLEDVARRVLDVTSPSTLRFAAASPIQKVAEWGVQRARLILDIFQERKRCMG